MRSWHTYPTGVPSCCCVVSTSEVVGITLSSHDTEWVLPMLLLLELSTYIYRLIEIYNLSLLDPLGLPYCIPYVFLCQVRSERSAPRSGILIRKLRIVVGCFSNDPCNSSKNIEKKHAWAYVQSCQNTMCNISVVSLTQEPFWVSHRPQTWKLKL